MTQQGRNPGLFADLEGMAVNTMAPDEGNMFLLEGDEPWLG